MGVTMGCLAALLLAMACPLQAGLLYHPRPYEVDTRSLLAPGGVELPYQTGCGRQSAFIVPPRRNAGGCPARLWVCFGGNASLALDWVSLVNKSPDMDAAFLLVDYPGYGKCGGKPSAAGILASTEAAMDALAAHLRVTRPELDSRLHLLGHSLGAATALQFAARHNPKSIVLVAPFTSTPDMVKLVTRIPMASLLVDMYDNRVILRQIAQRPERPWVTIIHGDADTVVPVGMGRELGQIVRGWGEYHEIRGGDHCAILTTHEDLVFKAMSRRQGGTPVREP